MSRIHLRTPTSATTTNPRELTALSITQQVIWAALVLTLTLGSYLLLAVLAIAILPAGLMSTIGAVVLPMLVAGALRACGRVRAWLRLPSARKLSHELTVAAWGLLALPVVFLTGQVMAMSYFSLVGSAGFEAVAGTRTSLSAAMTLLIVLVLAPIGEELVLRGLLQPTLRRRLSVPASIALTTALFMLMHGNMVQALVVLPLGLLLGLIAQYCARIWPVIALHACFNLASLLTPATWVAGMSQPLVLVVMLVACAATLLALARNLQLRAAR